MPGMPQGFNKLVSSLHGEIAAMTLGAEQVDVVCKERQSEHWAPGHAGRQEQPRHMDPRPGQPIPVNGLGAVGETGDLVSKIQEYFSSSPILCPGICHHLVLVKKEMLDSTLD